MRSQVSKLPFVSVIIPVYRDWERLTLCIKALRNQTYPAMCFEIIIVNNDPNDCPDSNYYLPDNARLINESRLGSYAARNAGIDAARGEIIAFTDSDCIPAFEWIENAVVFFEMHPEYDRIGGKIALFFSGDRYTWGEAYEIIYAFRQEEYVGAGKAATANVFTKREIFDTIGLFNASLISGGDFEWNDRASKRGFSIAYADNVVVHHPARKSVRQIIRKAKRVASGDMERYNTIGNDRSSLIKCVRLLYDLRPPLKDIHIIAQRGRSLTIWQKMSVFLVRYYVRISHSLETIKLINGGSPFMDNKS